MSLRLHTLVSGASLPGGALLLTVLTASFAAPLPAADDPPARVPTQIVAELETPTPAASPFLLRGTVPVPPGLFPRPDGRNPFVILDHDGTPLTTQAEVVSRYPVDADGADVVELLARVTRAPAAVTGSASRYKVALVRRPPLPSSWPFLQIPPVVRDLLRDTASIEIIATDCFGNRYVSRPMASPDFEILHRGPVHSEVRLYETMLPRNPVPGSTLPHFLGVHSYLSWFWRSPTVGLDLRFHNAHDGHDPLDPRDDALDTIYFQRIEIALPSNWRVLQDVNDPLFGAERVVGNRRFVEIVEPNPSGGLHVMRWQGQFHRRLALAPDNPDTLELARAYLDGEGRALCVRGIQPTGVENWSWWNAETARYFPQREQLPLLDHVGQPALRAELAGQLAFLVGHLSAGTGVGDYPISHGRLGWGHPYGIPYGGMTSGSEIFCYDGISAAASEGPLAFRFYSVLHRMQTDRMANALYQLDGQPSSVEEWARPRAGGGFYVPFEFWSVPLIWGSRPEPFGLSQAPTFQVDFVHANNLRPAYEQAYLSFAPHDYEHLIRYTRSAKVLAWLTNDSLACDDLRLQAENFHFSFHEHANDAFGGVQGTGLLSKFRQVSMLPGVGFSYGRGQAWGMDCAVAAYSLEEPEWRARKLPWFQRQTDVIFEGQSTCSGFIQSQASSKAFNGKYQLRQLIEQSITENALVGLQRSVFRGALPGHWAMVRHILSDSLRAFIGEMAWFPGEYGPWRYTGVGPLNPALGVWCSRADMAADAFTVGDIEAYQDWSSFAYGHELTGDPGFLDHARIQAGVANLGALLSVLENAGTDNIENRAPLLALMQRLTGEL